MEDTNPTDYERNAGQTYLLSWEQLAGEDTVNRCARGVFLAAGYCAANVAIPLPLLQAALPQDPGELAFSQALERLQVLGLLTPTPTGPALHPLLAEFARLQDQAAPASALPALADAMVGLAYEANTSGYPQRVAPYNPHLRSVAEASHADMSEKAATLWGNLGYSHQMAGDYPAARPCYEQVLSIRKEVLGEKHPDTARSLNNLGGLLDSMGDYSAARPYYEQALVIYREVLGEGDPDTAISLNNLGGLLVSMGDYSAARPYYEQALAIRKQVLGDMHPDTAQSLNNLGYLLQAMGDYPAARSYYEQALAIWEATLPPDHPLIQLVRGNLASLPPG